MEKIHIGKMILRVSRDLKGFKLTREDYFHKDNSAPVHPADIICRCKTADEAGTVLRKLINNISTALFVLEPVFESQGYPKAVFIFKDPRSIDYDKKI